MSLLHKFILSLLPAGCTVWKEEPLSLADSEPEPDLAVTLGDERDYAKAHPRTAELVVEIAVSSPALDRENASLYAEAGVKEYWIVLGPERKVEVHRRPENGRFREHTVIEATGALESASVPGLKFNVSNLFA